MLEQWQIDKYNEDGFLVVENVLNAEDISALLEDFNG